MCTKMLLVALLVRVLDNVMLPQLIADRRLWMESGRLVVAADPVGVERPAVERPMGGTNEPTGSTAAAFELPPAALVPQPPTAESSGWWRTAIPFVFDLSAAAVALGGIDRFVARRHQQVVETIRQQRRVAEEMALQDLRADVEGDLFERSDAYFVFLRDPRLTEADIRAANGWAAKAAVPLWIAMPAH